jgi:Bacteriodetes cell division protein (FtsL-like)
MAVNTFRERPPVLEDAPPPKASPRPTKKQLGFFDRLNNWITDRLELGDQMPTETLKRIAFVCLLGVVYIYVQYSYEGFIKKIDKARTEMEESRAAYISQKSKYMFASKQSEIAQKLKTEGLEENITPPIKIVIK